MYQIQNIRASLFGILGKCQHAKKERVMIVTASMVQFDTTILNLIDGDIATDLKECLPKERIGWSWHMMKCLQMIGTQDWLV